MYEQLYARGIAVGESNIIDGTMLFRHRNKTFTFDASDVIGKVCEYNGYFYEARVRELRALERRLKIGKGDGHGKRVQRGR